MHLLQMWAAHLVGTQVRGSGWGPAVHGYLWQGSRWVSQVYAYGMRSPDPPLHFADGKLRPSGTEPVLERWVALSGLLTATAERAED